MSTESEEHTLQTYMYNVHVLYKHIHVHTIMHMPKNKSEH